MNISPVYTVFPKVCTAIDMNRLKLLYNNFKWLYYDLYY